MLFTKRLNFIFKKPYSFLSFVWEIVLQKYSKTALMKTNWNSNWFFFFEINVLGFHLIEFHVHYCVQQWIILIRHFKQFRLNEIKESYIFKLRKTNISDNSLVIKIIWFRRCLILFKICIHSLSSWRQYMGEIYIYIKNIFNNTSFYALNKCWRKLERIALRSLCHWILPKA